MSGRPQPSTVHWRWVVGAAVGWLAVLLLALELAGGAPQPVPAGLPDAGRLTGWGLPITRLVSDLTAVLAVGLVLAAAALLPAAGRQLSGTALRGLQLASRVAIGWAAAIVVQLLLTASDLLGISPPQLTATVVSSFVTQTGQGKALVLQAGLAVLLAVSCRWTLTRVGARSLLVLALAALVPPLLTGHSAAESGHLLAVGSLTVHVVAVALWVGGLAALVWLAGTASDVLGTALASFSVLAGACLAVVALSGVVNAAVRLDGPAQLVTTGYGALVLAKAAALAALAVLGWSQRRRVIRRLRSDPAAATNGFWSLAAGELLLMGATIGLAVGLARTPLVS